LAQYTIWKHGSFYDQDKSSSGVIPVVSPATSWFLRNWTIQRWARSTTYD